MRPPYHRSLIRVFAFPRMTVAFDFNSTRQDLFARLHNAKNRQSLGIAIRIDDINNRFWISKGAYNITDFKGDVEVRGDGGSISGRFSNTGAWLFYGGLGFFLPVWLLLFIFGTGVNLFGYILFFIALYLVHSLKFIKDMSSIESMLANEFEIYLAQADVFSRRSSGNLKTP